MNRKHVNIRDLMALHFEEVEDFDNFEKPSSDKDTDQYTQWSVNPGNIYSPTIPTAKALPAGFYDMMYTQNIGPCLSKKTISADDLFVLPSPELEEIIQDIQNFWERRYVFKEYGLLHKRGILMYGEPGVGKSAIIQLCTKYLIENLSGLVINITNFDELEWYSSIVHKLRQIEPERPLIVILEDIESIAGDNSYTTSTLLNILDGVKQIDNVVYLATTNYPEKLEDRITNRPSRFDRRYEVFSPNDEIRRAYLKNKLSEDDIKNIDLDKWISETEGMSMAHLRELVISVVVMNNDFDETIERLNGMRVRPKVTKGASYGMGFNKNK